MTQNRMHETLLETMYGKDVENVQVKVAVVEETFIADGEEPYVSARPIYQRRYLEIDGEEFKESSAVVEDVPLAYMSTQKYADWTPVKKGDTGLLVFTDQAFDAWWDTGETDIEPDNTRTRNRSDAIFMPLAWAKNKYLPQPSTQWKEMRNMVNDLRVAISDEEGVHLQHKNWQQVLNEKGYDVIGDGNSLMDTLAAGFTSTAEGFFADAVGWVGAAAGFAALGQTAAAATSAAAAVATEAVALEVIEVVDLLVLIKGGAQGIIREEGQNQRP